MATANCVVKVVRVPGGDIAPEVAVRRIKNPQTGLVDALSCLRQLRANNCYWEARFAAGYVKANKGSYPEKLVNLCREILTRVSFGPLTCQENRLDILTEFFQVIPAGAVLQVTLNRDEPAEHAQTLLNFVTQEMLTISGSNYNLLLAICAATHWAESPDNNVLQVTTTDKLKPDVIAIDLQNAFQVVEVMREAPDKKVEKLLTDNPCVDFDWGLFNQFCEQYGYQKEKERAERYFPPYPAVLSLREMLELNYHCIARRKFLEAYIKAFYAEIGGKL